MDNYTRLDGGVLTWTNRQGPWAVAVTCDVNAPFDGPSEVRVWFSPDPDAPDADVDSAIASDGIPTTVLRNIPLAEIRAHARTLKREGAQTPIEGPRIPVPARMKSDKDYVLLVVELMRVRAAGEKNPQAALAAQLGIGRATMSERVKKAGELGLWNSFHKSITDKGVKLLREMVPELQSVIETQAKEP
ncbi:hypothetical protein [Streptomyces sp. NPDC059918]|uniref:hypothetical protein n=1 Tax=unclassified Streptomyces TaxID=2593676 RepID=UPI003659C2A8